MKLRILRRAVAVTRLPATASVPSPPPGAPLWSVTRTADELSVVGPEEAAPREMDGARVEPGWRALAVAGPLDFELVGVLARLAAPLAAAGIPIFVISTFDTDYLLVREEHLVRARRALVAAGHEVEGEDAAGRAALPGAEPAADDAGPQIEVGEEVPAHLPATLAAGLEAHAAAAGVAARRGRPLAVVARHPGGAVVGGLTGATVWGWLRVRLLWVAEEHRGAGLGGRLLRRAEEEAVGRGCRGAWVDTESFQAPGFYRRHGYEEMAALEDHPEGHRRIFLRKRLP